MAKLIDSSSDNESDFHINESYAKNYVQWREKEELQKLKDRYEAKDSSVSSSSSSSESENEDENWTASNEKEFLKTLSLLKAKDPKIYDKNISFFSTQDFAKNAKQNTKSKPLTLKDYERNLIIEKRYMTDNESENEQEKHQNPGYFEEQLKFKESFKAAAKGLEGDENDLFLLEGKDKEFATVKKMHKQQDCKPEIVKEEKNLKPLCNFWNDPNLEPGEVFLKDYILNKRYIEKNVDEIPTYEEIVNDGEGLSDDERILEKQETFEHKFNFRFEEPDPDFIKRYPRTIKDSLRRKDNRRKQKRDDYKKRKQSEKMQKREDLKRLKALKRKEIVEKIEKLKEITGNVKIGFEEMDITQDFDPEKHDERMNELFSEVYYADAEEERPQFPYDDELDYDEENWEYKNGRNVHDNMQDYVNYDYSELDTEYNTINDAGNKQKKHKKKSKFSEALAQEKPLFDPSLKSFEEYFDEYYKLDYEDIIGDMPCRFHYRHVVPNDFGLSTEEILLSKDKELNQWCSLKKVSQYRNEEEEYYDIHAFKRKSQNRELKKKILQSIYQESKVDPQKRLPTHNEQTTSVRKKSNFANSNKRSVSETTPEIEQANAKNDSELSNLVTHKKSYEYDNTRKEEANKNGICKKMHKNNLDSKNTLQSRKKNKRKLPQSNQSLNLCNERLTAYGINPKKYRNKLKYAKSNCV